MLFRSGAAGELLTPARSDHGHVAYGLFNDRAAGLDVVTLQHPEFRNDFANQAAVTEQPDDSAF